MFQARSILDARSNADDGVDDRRAIKNAAVGNQRISDFAIGEFGAWQITRVGVYRRVGVEQVEFRHDRGEIEIGVVERADGPDVFPVTVEQISRYVVNADGRGNHFTGEILMLLVFEQFAQRVVPEKVYAHRSDEGPAFGLVGAQAQFGCVNAHRVQLVGGWFFAEFDDAPFIIGFEQAEAGGVLVIAGDH